MIGVMPIQGAQGIFKANQPGQTRMMATGDFPCRQSKPPCMLPSMAFQVQIVVQ